MEVFDKRLQEIVEHMARGKNYISPGIVVAVGGEQGAESNARYKVRIPHLHGYADADGNNPDEQIISDDRLPLIRSQLKGTAPPNAQNQYKKYFKGDHVNVRIIGDEPENWEILSKIKPIPNAGGREKENIQNSLIDQSLIQDCEGSMVTDSPDGRECCTVITKSAKIIQNGKDTGNADRCGSGGKMKDGITAEIADFMKIVQSTDGKIGSYFVSGITGELFSMTGYIKKYVSSILGLIRSSINWIKAIITKYAKKAIDALVKAIMRPTKGATDAADSTLEQILNLIGCSFGNLEALLAGLLEDLLNSLLDTALNAVFGCLDPLIDGIINSILGAVTDLLNSILGAISSIAGLIGAFGDMIGEALNAILDFLGISCGGAGDCNGTGQDTLVSKFNSPGEYGMTYGLHKSLNSGLSAIDGVTSGIVTGSNGIDAALAAASSFASTVPLGTAALPGTSSSNPALVNAFTVAQGILGPAVSSVFDFCNSAATTAVFNGATIPQNVYSVVKNSEYVSPGSDMQFTVSRTDSTVAGAINLLGYKSTSDNIELSGANQHIDTSTITNPLSADLGDYIAGESTNPINITTAFGSPSDIFYSKKISFPAGTSSKVVTIPTTASGISPVVGYNGPGMYLDLTGETGVVTVAFSKSTSPPANAAGPGNVEYEINIPGSTAASLGFPALQSISGGTTLVNVNGGKVYGPLILTVTNSSVAQEFGTELYVGNDTTTTIPGGGTLTNQDMVVSTEDWNDFVISINRGKWVKATTGNSTQWTSPSNVTWRMSLFRSADDVGGLDSPDQDVDHIPNSSSSLNTAIGQIRYTSSSPTTPAAVASGVAAGPAAVPGPAAVASGAAGPAAGPAAAAAAAAVPGITNIFYNSADYSVVGGTPVVMDIHRTPSSVSAASTIRYTTSGITAIDGVHYTGGTGTILFDPASVPSTGSLRQLVIPTTASAFTTAVSFSVKLVDEIVPAGHITNLGGVVVAASGITYNVTIYPSGVVAATIAGGSGVPVIGSLGSSTAACIADILFTSTPPPCVTQPDTSPLNLGVVATTTVAGYTLSYQWQTSYSTSGPWTDVADGPFNTSVLVSTPTPIPLASIATPSGVIAVSGWTTTLVPTPASCTFSGSTSPTLTVNPLSHLINDQQYFRCGVTATPVIPSLSTPLLPTKYTPNTYVGVNSAGLFTTSVACSPVSTTPATAAVISFGGLGPVVVTSGSSIPSAPVCTPYATFPTAPTPSIPSSLSGPVVLPTIITPSSVTPSGPSTTPPSLPAPSPGIPAPSPSGPTTGAPTPPGVYVSTPVVGPTGGIVSIPIPPGLPRYTSPPLVSIIGAGFGAVAKAIIDEDGRVESVNVVSSGFGYEPNNPGNLCGILEGIQITTVGGYYEFSPTVYVDGDPDIAFAAINDRGQVVDIRITNPKDKVYDYIPSIELKGGRGAGATARARVKHVDCTEVSNEYLNIVDKYNTRRIGTVRIVDCP